MKLTYPQWGCVGLCILIIAMFCALAGGCGGEPRPLPPAGGPETASDTLGNLGETLVWVGGIGTAAGVALSLVALFYPPLGFLAGFFRFFSLGSIGIISVGSSLQWLSDRPWLMVLGILATVGSLVWWYWPRIHRAFDKRLAQG